MAAITRRKLSNLMRDIMQHAAEYDFLQLMCWLEKNWLAENLAIIPDRDISFPASDVKNCTLNKRNKLTLHLTFMGLCGVDSPLPHYFLEHAQQNNENANCLREFLNIFNNRLYVFLYLAWKKYHPVVQTEKYLNYLQFLSGNILTTQDNTEFALAGGLGASQHNSVSLAGLISEYLGGIEVLVKQFMVHWTPIGSLAILGKNNICLGQNALLGSQVVTKSQKIAIQIGPINHEQAGRLFPDQEQYKKLHHLICRYLGPLLLFDIILIIKRANIGCLKLDSSNLNLGWSSWLGILPNSTYRLQFHW